MEAGVETTSRRSCSRTAGDDARRARPSWVDLIAPVAVILSLFACLAWPLAYGPPLPSGFYVASGVLAVTLAIASAIDIATHRLPDMLTLPLAAAGLLASAWFAGVPELPLRALAAVVALASFWLVGAIYERLRGRAGLGFGDAKLFAAAGAWLGLAALPSVLLIACAGGIVAALVGLLRKRIDRRDRIAFGPFLALGIWAVWLHGPLA